MGRKRTHSLEGEEGEKLSPATKQSRLDDFFVPVKISTTPSKTSLKTQNNFDCLEAAFEEIECLLSPKDTREENCLFHSRDVDKHEGNKDTDFLTQQTFLVAETLQKIFTQLEHITRLLQERDKSTQPENLHNPFVHTRETESLTRRVTSDLQSTDNLIQTAHGRAPATLIYDPKSIVITVSPFWGRHIDWSSKWRARQHLAFLLRMAPSTIDLLKLERLPSARSQERFLLLFRTNNIPRQLFMQASELMGFGIRLQRHFRDPSFQKLVSSNVKRKDMAAKEITEDLMWTSDQNLADKPRKTASLGNILDQTAPLDLPVPMELSKVKTSKLPNIWKQSAPPNSKLHLDMIDLKPGLSEDEMDANLLSSFGFLPPVEQDIMITRLESLVHSLKDKQSSTAIDLQATSRPCVHNLLMETSKDMGFPSCEGNRPPLEPTVTIKKRIPNSNVIVPSDDPGLCAITGDCSPKQQQRKVGPV